MAEYIEREYLMEGRVENDPVRIAAMCAPAADVAPVRHGRWEKASEFMPIYRCSICKERNLFRNGDNVFSNYCPNCGAKMTEARVMREILFRGKSIDNGEWLYGHFTEYAGTAQIWIKTEDGTWNCIVDPATVGQYTGTKDKNGKRIFEGDIVRRDFGREGIGVQFAVVQYSDSYSPGFVFCPLDDWMYTVWRKCDVIGNIYDNQELLEAEKHDK